MKKTKYNLQHQSEVTGTDYEPRVNKVTSNMSACDKYEQTYYLQENFENRKFLFYKYKKKVGTVAIPVGLCKNCGKLEIEHDN